jgi:hypothetical protein
MLRSLMVLMLMACSGDVTPIPWTPPPASDAGASSTCYYQTQGEPQCISCGISPSGNQINVCDRGIRCHRCRDRQGSGCFVEGVLIRCLTSCQEQRLECP